MRLAAAVGCAALLLGQIKGTFYFSAPPEPLRPALIATSLPTAGDAERAWAAVRDTSSVAMLEEFRRQYPGSLYAGFAAARIDELRKAQAPAAVVAAGPALGAPTLAPRTAPTLAPTAPPALAPGAYDPVGAVTAFYAALGRADGKAAAALVVPEKQGKGPFSAQGIEQFFSKVREPLAIESIERAGNDLVSVKYRFTRSDGSVCRGDAKVNTTFEKGKTLIKAIAANC
jgi:hypothetical protein